MQIYKVNPSDKTVAAYGSPIAVSIGSSGSISEDVVFAVNGSDRTIVLIKGADGLANYSISDENGQFAEYSPLSDSAYKGDIRIEYAGDNNFYASMMAYDAESKHYWIELYKIGLETDIIPGE